MSQKFLIKFAWKCNHNRYGEIVSFIVSRFTETSPNCWGYKLSFDKSDDEVIRFKSDSFIANNIIQKLAYYSYNQWSPPSFGEIIEEEFNLDEFEDDYIYQDNYGREVLFHTHWECFN